jgi:sodium-dependent dicarboxylate transporter 2/3/5
MEDGAFETSRWTASSLGRVLGPSIFIATLLVPTGALQGDAKRLAAAVLWMVVWWITEAAPLAVTSLLPLVLFPFLGVRGVRDVAPNFSNHIIFLFLGGFILALAVEKSGLHKRIALAVLDTIGSSPRRLVWGFLVASAMLSMWLSDTATTLMMLPIAAGVAGRVDHPKAPARMLLAVAYGALIGGVGSLIGTPPNLVLAGMAPSLVPGLEPLSFGGWMLFGAPFVCLFLPVAGLQLGRGLPGGSRRESRVADERAQLGAMSARERRVAVLFGATAFAWITRAGLDFGEFTIPGWSSLLSDPKMVSDAVPAIAAAALATMIPSGAGRGKRLVSWDEISHGVPWGVLLLFGGGFAIADSVRATGLDDWLAGGLHGLANLPLPLAVLSVCLFTTTATELTSNTATATLLMPVMAALSQVIGVHPYLLMVPATVSASCAFMLPVATPPNAIVIGSGRVGVQDLFREGIWLNLAGALVTTFTVLTIGRLVLPLG